MRCAIYARVSTAKDAQKNSLENQIAFATDMIVGNGWTVAGRYIDDGISGATISKREEIKRLLEDARKKKFDAVIAKSVSRLGRNTRENMATADEIERLGIRLILPEDNYDTETSTSRLMFNLKAVLAEEESAKLSARIKIGRQSSAKQGKHLASLPPFGYKRDVGNKKLVLDDEFAPIVRKIFDLYLYEGWGWYKISNYLNDEKVPTPRSVSGASNKGTMWHQSSIRVILSNIVYTGSLVQHREEVRDFISKTRRKVGSDEHIVIENAHPAIISMDEYQAAQAKMRSKGKNKSNGQETLFAHIAVCADCGKGMVYRKDRGNGGAYICGGYVKYKKAYCDSHLIPFSVLLQSVKADLRELIESNVKLDRLFSAIQKEVGLHSTGLTKELQKVTKRLSQLNNEFQELFNLYTQKAISLEQFTFQNQSLQDEQGRLVYRKTELESKIDAKKDTDSHLRAFQQQIIKFARLDFDNEAVMKQVLQKLIQKVEVQNDGSIRITYNITRPQSLGTLDSRGA